MHSRAVTLMLSGAIGIFVSGCASTSPTFRGQSPHDMYGHAGCESGMCSPGGSCEPSGHGQCRSGLCNHGGGAGCNLPFHPVHRNFHTYHAPQGLMYPPENAPPAQVQYPYYTLRGPTDFFME